MSYAPSLLLQTATRLAMKSEQPASHRKRAQAGWLRPQASSGARSVLLQEFYGVADRENVLSGVIRNFAAEFFFEGHNQFDSVQAVGTEVIDERRIVSNFFALDTQVLDDDFLYAVCDVAHWSIPRL
jgi:hypothetical protein